MVVRDTKKRKFRTYSYIAYPTDEQYKELEEIREQQRQLYNAALEERIDAYKKEKISIQFKDQSKSLTDIRNDPLTKYGFSKVSSKIQVNTLRQLDRSFQKFFDRNKKGEKAGFPRFKSYDRFNSFGFDATQGNHFDGKKVKIKGVTKPIKLNLHRPLPEGCELRHLTFVYCQAKRQWRVNLQVSLPQVETLAIEDISPEEIIGIDVGITTLITISNEETEKNERFYKKTEDELVKAQQELSRCQRRSKNRLKAKRRLARIHLRIKNARKNHLHKVSRRIANKYKVIFVEKLYIKGMVKTSKYAKSLHDAAWGDLFLKISYKAEDAGGWLEQVDPKYTSQDCSSCGYRNTKMRNIRNRVLQCDNCGIIIGRDHNAAINILHRGEFGTGPKGGKSYLL